MNKYIFVSIASETNQRDYHNLGEQLAQRFLQVRDDCHVTKNTWCFNTDIPAGEIYNFLQNHIIHKDDQVFVAQFGGVWHTNGRQKGDCQKQPR